MESTDWGDSERLLEGADWDVDDAGGKMRLLEVGGHIVDQNLDEAEWEDSLEGFSDAPWVGAVDPDCENLAHPFDRDLLSEPRQPAEVAG